MEITQGSRDILRAARVGTGDIYMVPLAALSIEPGFNDAREADPDYPAHVEQIAQIMAAEGFYRDRPISVAVASDGRILITDGHTRHKAAHRANEIRVAAGFAPIEAVPVCNEPKGTTALDRKLSRITKNTSRPLTPLGEAIVIKDALSTGVSVNEVARRTGYSPAIIDARLTLLAAPQSITDLVRAGTVSATLAVATVKKEKHKAAEVLADAHEHAKATGSPNRIKPSHMNAQVAKGPSDTARLDWLVNHQVLPVCRSKPGMGRFYAIDYAGKRIGEGITPRDAIDAAMEVLK